MAQRVSARLAACSAILTVAFLVSSGLLLTPAAAQYGTITISWDGTVYPSNAPILNQGNYLYTLTEDISETQIQLQRPGIVFDGANHTVGPGEWITAVVVQGAAGVTVKNLRIVGHAQGIAVGWASGCKVIQNEVSSTDVGISTDYDCSDTNISFNHLDGCGFGINFNGIRDEVGFNYVNRSRDSGLFNFYARDSRLVGNVISSGDLALGLWFARNVTMRDNVALNNNLSFVVQGNSLEEFTHDIDESNLIDSLPIRYWIGVSDMTAPSDSGFIGLVDCTNVTVENFVQSDGVQGVLMAYTTDSTVRNNTFTNNSWAGVYLYSSVEVRVSGNVITGDPEYSEGIELYQSTNISIENNTLHDLYQGVLVQESSYANTIRNNSISSCDAGIELLYVADSRIIDNSITDCTAGIRGSNAFWGEIRGNDISGNRDYGMELRSGGDTEITGNRIVGNRGVGILSYVDTPNMFYGNWILNNTVQVESSPWTNYWDAGYPTGGNYWSDYYGSDVYSGPAQDQPGSDGIGDVPYLVDYAAADMYPLMLPYPPDPTERMPRGQIAIFSDSEFTPENGVTGGSGTSSDPYIIEGWSIVPTSGYGIDIEDTTAYVVIRNVTVHSGLDMYGGMWLSNAMNVAIEDCDITRCAYGVSTYHSDNLNIQNMRFDNCSWDELFVTDSEDVYVSDCEFADTPGFSVWLTWCDNVTVERTSTMRCELAIEADYSNNVTFADNVIGNSWYGFWFVLCTNSTFVNNTAWGLSSEGFYVDTSTHVLVADNIVLGADQGIEFQLSQDCVAVGNTLSDILNEGICLYNSEDVLVDGNIIERAWDGVSVDDWGIPTTYNITFSGNIIRDCEVGASFSYAYGFTMTGNTVEACSLGIDLYYAVYLDVVGNYFINNTVQANLQNVSDDYWDHGYPQGGNYWSDYSGADLFWGPRQNWAGSDGIGDAPYVLGAESADNYPLMQPGPPSLDLTTRGPIRISSNSEFTPANGVVGGSGTLADPYVISGWEIEPTTADGIWIGNTDAYFVVQQCYIHSGAPSYQGIHLSHATNGVLTECLIMLLQYDGIEITSSSDIVVEDCVATWCGGSGIYSMGGHNISFIGNLVGDNSYYGLVLNFNTGDVVQGNEFVDNGIVLFGNTLEEYGSHTITSDNTVNGEPLLYYKDMSGVSIDGDEVGQLIVVNCTDVDVSNIQINNTDTAIEMQYVSDVSVSASQIYDCAVGIQISHGTGLTVTDNALSSITIGDALDVSSWVNGTITDNSIYGGFIGVSVGAADSMAISRNTIFSAYGIWLTRCTDSVVDRNVLDYCSWGMILEQCSGLLIYYNEVNVFGTPASDDMGAENQWDSGYPAGGNFWARYSGTDTKHGPGQNLTGADGIGDTPYVIDGNSTDLYPLMSRPSLDVLPPTTWDDHDTLWHNADFTISLWATDINSGVLDTYYLINGGPVMSVGSDGQPLITREGSDNVLVYWSVDRAGNEESPRTVSGIKLDKTPPIGSVVIDGGATYTTDRSLSLSLSATDNVSGVSRMRLSTDNSTWSVWQAFSTSKLYPVLLPDGVVTVYVQFSDVAGCVSRAYSDSIILDTTDPVADAGGDRSVDQGSATIFDGSGSYDQNGIVSYNWTIGTPTPEYLVGQVVTYTFSEPGTYTVSLTVTDAVGHVGSDVATITVIDITPPAADAGSDVTVGQHSVVSFDGSGSSDNVGVVNWTWSFVDGPSVTLWGRHAAHVFDSPGVYVVTLTVTDAAGLSGTDSVVVTVVDTEDPVARAGPNVAVNLGTAATLDGSQSTDNVGVASYTWSFFDSVPTELIGSIVQHTFSAPGLYTVTLEVLDAEGNSDTDTLTVTVNGPPTADAGGDQRVNIGTTVTFSGEGSSDDVGVVNYTWSFVYRGSTVHLYSGVASFEFSTAGSYVATLTVRDGGGLSASDSMTLVVNGPPVADAGPDMRASMGSLVTLDGTGSSDDLDPLNYTWTISAMNGTGPSWPMVLYGQGPVLSLQFPDLYIVTLTVRDGGGLTDTDTMIVTVVDDSPPVADAGPDLTIDMAGTAALDGSASHDNLGIAMYVWTFTDVVERTLLGEHAVYTFDMPGTYTVVLNVTDGGGNYDTDVITVFVRDTASPVSVITAPSGPESGVDMVFSANASSDNVGVVSYAWEFGDGSTGTGRTVVHKYLEPGTYIVNLTVTDSAGNNDTSSYTIVVGSGGGSSAAWIVGGVVAVAALALVALVLFRRRRPSG